MTTITEADWVRVPERDIAAAKHNAKVLASFPSTASTIETLLWNPETGLVFRQRSWGASRMGAAGAVWFVHVHNR